ncbi:hypothetical protein KY285_022560 [Solanum tuberosum]|nr:hypothetical protein KY284_022033 [Solanum tuberosum]KAH0695463.1 hypothetical protein KY285_022560 [Solanum tuberosum]
MAREPPVGLFRPPDQSHQERLNHRNKTHQQSPTNSTSNSVNSLFSGNYSPNQDLQHTTNSSDSIIPIARSDEAISGQIANESPERRLQIRASSQQIRGDLNSGDYSHNKEVHLTAISSKMDAQIVGGEDSGGRDGINKEIDGDIVKGSNSTGKVIHFTNISTNLTQEKVQEEIPARMVRIQPQQTNNHQPETAEPGHSHGSNTKGNPSRNHEDLNSQKQPQQVINVRDTEEQYNEQAQNYHLLSKSNKVVEVVDVESSSQFSFGVKAVETTPSNAVQQRPGKEVQVQQISNTKSHDNASNEKGTQSGKATNSNLGYNAVIMSSSEGEVQMNAKGHQAGSVIEQEQTRQYKQGGSSDPNSYHNAFPKISNNFEKHVP